MTAAPLGPDHKLGSKPEPGHHPWNDRKKNLQELTDGKGNYIAGHLLNQHLGGPGDDSRNLTAIPQTANKLQSERAEESVKRLVNQEKKFVFYEVNVEYKYQNIGHVYYASRIKTSVAAVDSDGKKIGATERNNVIDIPAPMTIRAGAGNGAVKAEAKGRIDPGDFDPKTASAEFDPSRHVVLVEQDFIKIVRSVQGELSKAIESLRDEVKALEGQEAEALKAQEQGAEALKAQGSANEELRNLLKEKSSEARSLVEALSGLKEYADSLEQRENAKDARIEDLEQSLTEAKSLQQILDEQFLVAEGTRRELEKSHVRIEGLVSEVRDEKEGRRESHARHEDVEKKQAIEISTLNAQKAELESENSTLKARMAEIESEKEEFRKQRDQNRRELEAALAMIKELQLRHGEPQEPAEGRSSQQEVAPRSGSGAEDMAKEVSSPHSESLKEVKQEEAAGIGPSSGAAILIEEASAEKVELPSLNTLNELVDPDFWTLLRALHDGSPKVEPRFGGYQIGNRLLVPNVIANKYTIRDKFPDIPKTLLTRSVKSKDGYLGELRKFIERLPQDGVSQVPD